MASLEAIRDRLDVEDAERRSSSRRSAPRAWRSACPLRGSARTIVREMIKHLCSSISYGGAGSLCGLRASAGCRSRPLPDPAHRVVSPRIVRALRAMSGLARLAPTSSRLFAHATAGMFIFGLRAALPGTSSARPPGPPRSVGCDVAAQANLLVVFFTGRAHVHGGRGHCRRSLRRAARAHRRHGPADARVPRAGSGSRARGAAAVGLCCSPPAARRSTPPATRSSP